MYVQAGKSTGGTLTYELILRVHIEPTVIFSSSMPSQYAYELFHKFLNQNQTNIFLVKSNQEDWSTFVICTS